MYGVIISMMSTCSLCTVTYRYCTFGFRFCRGYGLDETGQFVPDDLFSGNSAPVRALTLAFGLFYADVLHQVWVYRCTAQRAWFVLVMQVALLECVIPRKSLSALHCRPCCL